MKYFLTITSALASTSAFAHPGHLVDESVHGMLHAEYIVALVAIGIAAVLTYCSGKR